MTIAFPDWLAICETKARYCRLMDTKDWQGWADCFVEDLVLDTSPAGGLRVEGRDAAVAYVRGAIEQARTAHQVHNPEIALEPDGASARVVWAMNDRVEMAQDRQAAVGEVGHTGYGHYHERYVRCPDGAWRIAETRLSYLQYDSRPLPSPG
ncbi:nuclear transport factor 2 family protein [Novosphingobium soli]|uniref:Nuclear transport factor 2 family protein n=1 Tax=Novosphingobium soli TaxID=574956 RepID=A0ABV6CUE7_9SPHN